MNMYGERSGVVEVAMTSFTTTSTMRYLRRVSGAHARTRGGGAHAAAVHLCGEGLEVVGGAEARVELGGVRDPVAVVRVAVRRARAGVVLADGADPDCAASAGAGAGRGDVLAVKPAFWT